MRPALKATDRNNTHLNTKSNVQTVMVQNAWQLNFKGCNVNLQTENDAFQIGMQQCCAISQAKMLPVLLDLKDHVETSCSFSFDFFSLK